MEALALRGFFTRWYREHGRSFPWRERDCSPYGLLVAEMLLRQTQANMVAPVWERFLSQYPTPSACLDGDEQELLALVAPLGLGRQRADALRKMSATLVTRHAGRVPRSLAALQALPHVGVYAAHAVACFAFGQHVPVVDMNVIRVFSRITGVGYGRDNRRAPAVWELARAALPTHHVREHNYGLLDFAAQVCKSRAPACKTCPLVSQCQYGASVLLRAREA